MTQVTESPAAAGTATTAGARAHAREQHGRTVDTMRHVPATAAPERLTAGLTDPAAALTWVESLAFGRYTTMTLARGTRIRLTDTSGDACVHALLYRAGALHERLNIADTVKVPWQAYPSTGHPLLSDAGRLMATIVTDTSSRHDALTGATTLEGNTARYGAGTAHSASPAARELLTLGALKSGLGPRDVAPSLTLFKGIKWTPPATSPSPAVRGRTPPSNFSSSWTPCSSLPIPPTRWTRARTSPAPPWTSWPGTRRRTWPHWNPVHHRTAGSRTPAGTAQHRTRSDRKERPMNTATYTRPQQAPATLHWHPARCPRRAR